MIRVCATCSGVEFYASGKCKACTDARTKAYRAKHLDAINQRRVELYQQQKAPVKAKPVTDPKETRRQWNEKNAEKIRKQYGEWLALNREKKQKSDANWRKSNTEAATAKDANRRARFKQAPGSFTGQEIRTLFNLQKATCVVCRGSLKGGYEIDHIAPLARGGHNNIENLQLLCRPCNRSKAAKDPIDFMQRNGYLI